eukprot:TRINITY_DN3917_c0_g2_i1.p1 TRINITY_DN3917_c0_g2~~TRINITY_DN3917_c0_g2_i1.p1  ORF type:complete len:192 (+),score=24.65 TRINITY_DN3917_c0_g2_i1:29-577(+)
MNSALFVSFILLIALFALSNEDQTTIGADEYIYTELTNINGNCISYKIDSINKSILDVYVMDNLNFEKLKNGQKFSYIISYSCIEILHCENSFPISDYASVIVVTNENILSDAIIDYSHEIKECSEEKEESKCSDIPFGYIISTAFVTGFLIVIIFIVVVVVYMFWKRRRNVTVINTEMGEL